MGGAAGRTAKQSIRSNLPTFLSNRCGRYRKVPKRPLHTLDDNELDQIVEHICSLMRLEGFRASLATKVLHPKRHQSVPVLDNSAFFGTWANPKWNVGEPRKSRSGGR